MDRGRNTWGQLGTGDDEDILDEASDSVVAVDLDGSSASAIAAGEGHVCALLDDASVKVSKRGSSAAHQIPYSGLILAGDDFGDPDNDRNDQGRALKYLFSGVVVLTVPCV